MHSGNIYILVFVKGWLTLAETSKATQVISSPRSDKFHVRKFEDMAEQNDLLWELLVLCWDRPALEAILVPTEET